MTDDEQAVPALDTKQPNVARIWDFLLGGKDNFAADRHAADTVKMVCEQEDAPTGAAIARETRAWVSRAVRFLAERGIDQFIDLGVGLPARGNVHEFAQRINAQVRTIYVDNDAMVMAYGCALLADNPLTIAIHGDLRDPDSILANPDLRALLDLRRPVAVLLVAVLDLLPDEQAPASILARIRDAVAPGSYLAITHVTSDIHEKAAAAIVEKFTELGVNTPMVPRPGDAIRRLFDGWDLMEPGLVSPARWHPELAERHEKPKLDSGWAYAGIGYLTPLANQHACAKATANTGRTSRARRRSGPANRAGTPSDSPAGGLPSNAVCARRPRNERSGRHTPGSPRGRRNAFTDVGRPCALDRRSRTLSTFDAWWHRRSVVASAERGNVSFTGLPGAVGPEHGSLRDRFTPHPSSWTPGQACCGERRGWTALEESQSPPRAACAQGHPELADWPAADVPDPGWPYPAAAAGNPRSRTHSRALRYRRPPYETAVTGSPAAAAADLMTRPATTGRPSARPEIPAQPSSPSPGEEGLCHVVSGADEAHRSAVACGARQVQREVGDR